MEEGEYKSTYNELAPVRCVFEKALTHNQAKCRQARHFWLADREGYSCKSSESSSICRELMEKLRENSKFVLKLHDISGPLPHNMEIRVQVGGLRGLQVQLDASKPAADMVNDVCSIIEHAIEKYTSLQQLPYSEIMQSVTQYQGRKRRQRD